MRPLLPLCVAAAAASLPAVASAVAPCDGAPFNVRSFGARGDGAHNDGPSISAAIAAAAACGGGTVLLPYFASNSSTFLSGPLFLESNVVFFVAPGATLLATSDLRAWLGAYHKPSGLSGFPTPGLLNGGRCVERPPANCTTWHKLHNVTITGGGVIDGNGPSFWGDSTWWPGPAPLPRPFLLDLIYVDGLTVSHVSLLRSALWTLVPSMCSNVLLEHIFLDAGVQRDVMPYNGYNVDGLDSNNVQNMTLRHSYFRAGDDCVAINSRNIAEGFPTRNVSIVNLTCITPITIGSGTGNGVFDVTIRDSLVDARWGAPDPHWMPKWAHTGLRLKTARNRGSGGAHGVRVQNLTVLGVDLAVDIQSWYSCQNSSGPANYQRSEERRGGKECE
jgi:polygalacturonase